MAGRVEEFAAAHGWAGAAVVPLAADASFRRYFRLTYGAESALVMDAPPAKEDVRPWLRLARHLCALGYSAPRVLAADEDAGLVLIEDLGDDTFTRLLARGTDEAALYELAVDVLIPGARPDVINAGNKDKVRAKIIVEAANIPVPLDIEAQLEKKMLVVPDIVANSGGVISSYIETINGTPEQMLRFVKEKVTRNARLVLEKAHTENKGLRKAAVEIAQERVRKAMK